MRKTGCQIVDGLDLSVQKPLFNTLLQFCPLSKYCYRETSGLKNIRDLLDKLTVGDVLGRNGGSCRCSLSSYGIFKPYVFWTVGQTLGMYNKETLADESNEKNSGEFTQLHISPNTLQSKSDKMCSKSFHETYFVIRNFLLKYPLSLSTLLD